MKYQSREIRKEFIMGSKITIIGAGSVGSTIAHILSLKPYVSELVMIDILKDKADGEIMDMAQGTGFRDPISMIAGDYEDAAGSDIVSNIAVNMCYALFFAGGKSPLRPWILGGFGSVIAANICLLLFFYFL